MTILPIEDLLKGVGTRYALVNFATKRTRQLLSGSPPLVKRAHGEKLTVISLKEILAEKVVPQAGATGAKGKKA